MPQLDRAYGRQAFGDDPGNYDAARPDYPDWVFETLKCRCGLGPNAEVFEIGAGTGKATRPLLEAGANPVVAIEPDARLAAFLTERADSPALRVLNETFEAADLPAGAFDLGVSATAFHWLDEDAALAKIATLLKPGGWWAAIWNTFGDDSRPDPFHDATLGLFEGATASPSSGAGEVPFGVDVERRRAALERSGAFEQIEHRLEPWPLVLDPRQTMALYATYSNVTARADRDWLLSELGRVAEAEFDGRVIRNMTTSLYIARRRARGVAVTDCAPRRPWL